MKPVWHGPVRRLVGAAARETGQTVTALRGSVRTAPLARVRFAVVWVARTALGRSWRQIGIVLRRDHSTMIHAFRRAEALRESDPLFRDLTDRLLAATQQKDQ